MKENTSTPTPEGASPTESEKGEPGVGATGSALRERATRDRLLIESWAQAVWETDAEGHLVNAGETLSKALGMEQRALSARFLWDLSALPRSRGGAATGGEETGAAQLREHHAAQDAFCDLLLGVRTRDGVHRLSLSGHPRYDARGRFTDNFEQPHESQT